ncbi:MAG: amidohydrolase [Gammaproteobacteria bacterium]|jgi:hippurate hydrolase|nr:amidohydrolase [Gammaproteobacteria bacterium]MDP6165782.1 M20 aminoacylase family protein [Gammaproteobacteria bacterium]
MNLVPEIIAKAATYTALRKDIHAHPELGYEEQRTAALVVKWLKERHIEVHEGIGVTGVVGVIAGDEAGPGLAIRADMDALALSEENTFSHASKHQGKMHACGHDGHTASLLAAADYLCHNRNFAGTLYLIFQPAEEGGAGAKAMMDDGLFERFSIDEIYGYHNWAGHPEGHVALASGPIMASASEFKITVAGKGSHAALPHLGVDSLLVATHLVQALQSIVSRNVSPVDSVVLSVTKIVASDATNIVAESCVLEGTVRCFTEQNLVMVEERMAKLTTQLCSAFGAQGELDFWRAYPATVNHVEQTQHAKRVAEQVVGAERVVSFVPTMGSEDFSFFLQAKPGCYLMIGNGDGEHRDSGHGLGPCALHNPSYDFNDGILTVAASLWVALVRDRLGPNGIQKTA